MRVSGISICVVFCSFLNLLGQSPEEKKPLTAREMFFAGRSSGPGAKPPEVQASATPAKAPERPTRPRPEPPASKPPAPPQSQLAGEPKSTPVVSAANIPSSAGYVPAPHVPPAANPNFRNVSYPQGLLPLGVRYSLLLRGEGNQFSEVTPDRVFHSGDRIRLSVEVNDTGYLYIVHRGSSGTWKLMFPASGSQPDSNRVEKGRRYLLPPGSVFTFVGDPGEEKLFLVLSRQPEADLETLIDSLRSPAQPEPAAQPRPGRQQLQLASARLPDDIAIDKLRRMYSRDLITEKIDDEANNGRPEDKAVYVVNSSRQPDSRVVADIQLKHQ